MYTQIHVKPYNYVSNVFATYTYIYIWHDVSHDVLMNICDTLHMSHRYT